MLESEKIGWAQCVCFCDDWDKVDASAKTLHDFDVERLETVASGSDKVQTNVDTKVNLFSTTGLLLLKHVRLMLVVEEFNDWLP